MILDQDPERNKRLVPDVTVKPPLGVDHLNVSFGISALGFDTHGQPAPDCQPDEHDS
jgi:hypothetical protein